VGFEPTVTSLPRSISSRERSLRRSVNAPITPHEVPQYGPRNFFQNPFLLCGRDIPTLVSPSCPGTPWGPVASLKVKSQGLNMKAKGGAALPVYMANSANRGVQPSALHCTSCSKRKAICIQTEVTGAPLYIFLSRELGSFPTTGWQVSLSSGTRG
jgi:hypothetical protein